MNGKEIMLEAEKRSEGLWKPSPGLIYPLLGKLLSNGLIEEAVGGGYKITERGLRALEEYTEVQKELTKQFQVIMKLGLMGKVLALDFFDRIMSLISTLGENLDKLGERARERYKAFLEEELKKRKEKSSSF